MAGIRTHPLRLSIGGRAGTFVSELVNVVRGLLGAEVRPKAAGGLFGGGLRVRNQAKER